MFFLSSRLLFKNSIDSSPRAAHRDTREDYQQPVLNVTPLVYPLSCDFPCFGFVILSRRERVQPQLALGLLRRVQKTCAPFN